MGEDQGIFRNAEAVLPQPPRKPNKAWISDSTMAMIDQRSLARANGNLQEERRLHKLIRGQAKTDRTDWFERMLATGDWGEIRRLRRPRKAKQGRLRNARSELVENIEWAETMADHLEHVQWKVRPTGLVDGPQLGQDPEKCVD